MTSPWHHSFRYNWYTYVLSLKVLWTLQLCFLLDKYLGVEEEEEEEEEGEEEEENVFKNQTSAIGSRAVARTPNEIRVIYMAHDETNLYMQHRSHPRCQSLSRFD